MNAQHTPGPWRQWRDMDPKQPLEICAPSDDFVCTITMHNTNAMANARLIAAAPDLLYTLQLIHANAAESPEWIRRHTAAAIAKALLAQLLKAES